MANEATVFELAHVLFMDLVGYSQMLIDDQRDVLQQLKAIVRGSSQFRAAEEQKKLVCLPTGDGMAVAFFTAPDAAVRFALEIAEALRSHPEIQLRMGIHSGPVSRVADVNESTNVAGGGINMAQRVMDCGDAGHILLSGRVAEDLAQFREWNACIHDLGECEVKHGVKLHLFSLDGEGFGNPAVPTKLRSKQRSAVLLAASKGRLPLLWTILGTAALIAAGLLLFHSSRAPSQPSTPPAAVISDKSIAVLPFENLSDDKGNAYFVDGIQDEILTRLAKVADLKVISRTSTQPFRSKPENLPDIARQLNVAHILEGSVQRLADQVRVNVQLIKATGDNHLWAETYDRKLTDVFAVETEIATRIAETLQAKLTGAEHVGMAARPTENMEAHDLYLKGRFIAGKRLGDSLRRAIEYYDQALTKDPNYALAYAGIADSYALLPEYTSVPAAEAFEKGRAAAQKALSLDPNLAEAHTSLGLILQDADIDLKGAKREFERAIELNPNYAGAHYFLGLVVLAPLGRFDEAIAELKRAVELDPLSAIINMNLGHCYYLARRYPEAIAQFQRSEQLDPNASYIPANLGMALSVTGDFAGAIAAYQKSNSIRADYHPLMLAAYTCGISGDRDKALQFFEQAKELEQHEGATAAYLHALVSLGLGDKEQAIDWLERSYQAKETGTIICIKVDPLLDPLRENPRFEALANTIIPPDLK